MSNDDEKVHGAGPADEMVDELDGDEVHDDESATDDDGDVTITPDTADAEAEVEFE